MTSQSVARRGRSPPVGDNRTRRSGTPWHRNPSRGDVTVRRWRTSRQAILAHGACPSSAVTPAQASGVTARPLPTPSPHLLSCARRRCFTPVTEASDVSSQGPVGSLWPRQTSPGTYGHRVHSLTPRASLGGSRTKSHRLCPHPSTAGQPSGLPCFLPRGVPGSACLALAGLLLSFSPSLKAHG